MRALRALLLLCLRWDQAAPRAYTLRESLDCRWHEGFSAFLDRLLLLGRIGLPRDGELEAQAIHLLREIRETGELEIVQEYDRPIWKAFRERMCQLELYHPPPCIYGIIATFWVLIRTGALEMSWSVSTETLLQDACSLGGWDRTFVDFAEESSWPILPLDLCAGHHAGEILAPGDVPRFVRLPDAGPSAPPPSSEPDLGPPSRLPAWRRGALRRVVAWEVGMHSAMSAEALTGIRAGARTVGLDLEARNLVNSRYPPLDFLSNCIPYENARMPCRVVVDEISGAFDKVVKGREPIEDMNEMSDFVENVVAPRRGEFDLVVVTSPPMVLLGVVMGSKTLREKPMILYSSSFLYERLGRRHWLLQEALFAEASQGPRRAFALPDEYEQHFFERRTGLALPIVPAMALYTGVHAPVNVTRPGQILVVDRSQGADVLPCILQHAVREFGEVDGVAPSFELWRGLSWKQMAHFDCAAFFPYTVFQMIFDELYRMPVPILVPRHLSKHSYQYWFSVNSLRSGPMLEEIANNRGNMGDPGFRAFPFYNPWNYSTFQEVAHTAHFSRRHVRFFDSLPDLLRWTSSARSGELADLRAAMRAENARAKREALDFWGSSLRRIL